MFSQTAKPNVDAPKETPRERNATESAILETDANVVGSLKPAPPSRAASYTEKRPQSGTEAERKQNMNGFKKDPKESDPSLRRFELLPDGSHEHLLKSAKRQEKLSVMLRDMLGGKKKEEQAHDDQELSLMSTWVDQLKLEKDKLAADKKGGPSSTATLVEKYGKCQEIVGRGAFGIVRISHKTNPKDSKTEQLYAVKEFRRRPQEDPKKYQKRLNIRILHFLVASASECYPHVGPVARCQRRLLRGHGVLRWGRPVYACACSRQVGSRRGRLLL